ncbi:MAG: phage tail tube protein [Clostridium sp.]
MAKGYTANQSINGSFGEVWFDDDYLSEIESAQAELSMSYTDVPQVRKLTKGKKLTNIEGSGTLKMHHVRSTIMKKVSDLLKRGKTPSFKIIIKLDDPDALGAERVVLYSCKLTKLTLMDWEFGKVTEETIPFTFEDWDLLDVISA